MRKSPRALPGKQSFRALAKGGILQRVSYIKSGPSNDLHHLMALYVILQIWHTLWG